jgi:hypothetical protein
MMETFLTTIINYLMMMMFIAQYYTSILAETPLQPSSQTLERLRATEIGSPPAGQEGPREAWTEEL